jgi:hypothetical protein
VDLATLIGPLADTPPSTYGPITATLTGGSAATIAYAGATSLAEGVYSLVRDRYDLRLICAGRRDHFPRRNARDDSNVDRGDYDYKRALHCLHCFHFYHHHVHHDLCDCDRHHYKDLHDRCDRTLLCDRYCSRHHHQNCRILRRVCKAKDRRARIL